MVWSNNSLSITLAKLQHSEPKEPTTETSYKVTHKFLWFKISATTKNMIRCFCSSVAADYSLLQCDAMLLGEYRLML